MKISTKLLGAAILLCALFFASLPVFADDFIKQRVSELTAEVVAIRGNLEESKSKMMRLDYYRIEDILATISHKLAEAAEVGSADEDKALRTLIDINQELKNIKPLMDESLPVETRGIWVDNVTMRNLLSKADVERFMEDMASINVNFLIIDAYNNGAATYPSKVAAEHYESQIYEGDKLKDIIEIARQKGIEIHTLINTFGVGTGINHFLDEKMAWLDKTYEEKYTGSSGHYWISPMVPEAREYVMSILKELVVDYGVDGIQLDYVRYDTEFGYHEYARELYKSLFGIDPFDIQFQRDKDNFTVFKTQFVNRFVERAFFELKELKPDLLVSASTGSPYSWYKLDLGQDWATWAENRNISFFCPMSYTGDVDHYRRIAISDLGSMKGTTYIFPGLGVYLYDEYVMQEQIAAGRTTAISGQTIFSTANMKPADYEVLKAGIWKEPAVPTFRDPRAAAELMLGDLALRIQEFEPYLGAESGLASSYLIKIEELKGKVADLQIRPWDTRNLREESPEEVAQLEPLIASLKEFSKKVAGDAESGRVSPLTGERITLELSKVIALLEPLVHTAKPFVYVSTYLL
ncbi:MAG TPA: family 10 glycosylhydrolase [Bacillota bacterium]|nr:family 10 glycosylhydrolase [Bacillota bacterium]